MNRMTRVVALGLLALVLLVGGVGAAALPRPEPLGYRLAGTLNIVSGDLEDLSGPPVEVFTLVTAEGQETRLILGPELRAGLDLYSLNGREVIVTGADGDSGQVTQSGEPPASMVVTAIEPAPGAREAGAAALIGNTKWLSIACKFADIPDEPKTLSYFQNMYGTTYPGLDAYWQEASYGNINLAGSHALGWVTLPKPMSAYQIDDATIRWTDLFLDCAALVDPLVNFNDYMGVNLMLNGKPGCCAWGGYRTVTLDGVNRKWSVTWLPPFAYTNQGYVQHEMTHAYGILWHSYANDNGYGDPWDVVSWATAYYGDNGHPVYGKIGQHTQAYHRRYLGWLPESRMVTVSGDKTTLTLERATQPGATGPLMAIIPIDGAVDHYYALEARRRVGFDGHLMGDSITIHEIGGARHTVQLMDPYAIGGSYGYQVWDAGDTWVAPEGGITVHVDAITPTGFTITVRTGLETRTLVMPVIADTYIDHEAPQSNFGTSTILKTRGALSPDFLLAKAAILKFEPASVPQNVARAHLRLTLAEGTIGGHLPRVESKYTMPSWEEAVLTWENAPLAIFGFSEPYVFQPTVTGTNWMEWDISGITAVRGSEALSALVVDNGLFTFSSREGANPPQLIVDYLVEPTAALTLTPVNDAHVNELYPTTVYGDGPGLRVRNAATDQNAYVKFNLKSVDKAVQKATLRLYVTDAGPDGGGLYRVSPTYPGTTTQWLETDITWLNAPPISGAPITQIGAVVAGKWVELDVTGAAQAAMTDFNGRLSLALRSGASDLVVYSSKEGEHAPELVLKLGNNPPPPTSTPTATATNTPKPSPTATASPTVTPSPTMTPSPTVTMSPTPSPTPSPTMTPSPTPTSGPSPTPSATATAGPSPIPTTTRPAEQLWRVFLPFAARPSVPTP